MGQALTGRSSGPNVGPCQVIPHEELIPILCTMGLKISATRLINRVAVCLTVQHPEAVICFDNLFSSSKQGRVI